MPQIEVESHSNGQACTSCHNPHSPLFSITGQPIVATGGAGTVDIVAGKKLSATCAACHGPEGVSATAMFPNLACQKQPYLAGELAEFQSGKRANPVMSGIAKGLSTADIQNVAAYYSGISCK
jgi:cytochrome c553